MTHPDRAFDAVGVVVAGGRSTRMGTSKAALEWHSSTLLRRVTGIVARAIDGPVIVVRAPGQELPTLDPHVLVREDPEEGRGPMMGLAVGLAAGAEHAPVAFVCSTDLPFLHSAFVSAVLHGFDAAPAPDVVLPVVGGYRQPTAAGYRTELAPVVGKLVEARRLRPANLFDEITVRRLDENALLADARLAAADPALDSVFNVNTPDDYRAARERPAPEVVVGEQKLRASTLGQAGLTPHVLVTINGKPVDSDAETPLETGDTVSFS